MLCVDEQRKMMFCAEWYRVVLVHLCDILQLYSFHAARYMLVSYASQQVRGKFDRTKLVKRSWDDTVLPPTYPVHWSASEVNCSGADVQVSSHLKVSCRLSSSRLLIVLVCMHNLRNKITHCSYPILTSHNYSVQSQDWNVISGFWECTAQSRDCTKSDCVEHIHPVWTMHNG